MEPSGSVTPTAAVSGTPIALQNSTWKPGDAEQQALLEGKLEVVGNCVVVSSYGLRRDVLWPVGWTALQTAQGIEIKRPDGSVAISAGGELKGGGGIGTGKGCSGGVSVILTDDLRG